MAIKKYARPSPALAPYIERYWGFESTPREVVTLPKLLPGTGAELFLHYRTPFAAVGADERVAPLPRVHLLSLRGAPLALAPRPDVGFIAVRFRAGALRHFLPVPAGELVDRVVAVEDLPGEVASLFADCLPPGLSWKARVVCVDAALQALARRFEQPDCRVDQAVRTLYYAAPGGASQAEVGGRQLRRWFNAAVGVGPKRFQRLARFQQTVRSLLLNRTSGYLPTALDHGYFDQAHFIHEFTRLAGETPGRFLREPNFMSHFYNPSARASANLPVPEIDRFHEGEAHEGSSCGTAGERGHGG